MEHNRRKAVTAAGNFKAINIESFLLVEGLVWLRFSFYFLTFPCHRLRCSKFYTPHDDSSARCENLFSQTPLVVAMEFNYDNKRCHEHKDEEGHNKDRKKNA